MAERKSAAGIPARAAGLAILREVLRKRRTLDEAAAAILGGANLDARDRGFARAIGGETLRRLGQLEALIRAFVPKLPPQNRAGLTYEILLAGACELLFLGVPAHAAIDSANELAARGDAKHFKPLINAVLRRVAREGEAIVAAQDAPRLNTPDWLWARWRNAYGEETARKIAAAHLVPPPLDILPKPPATAVPDGVPLPGGVLRLPNPGPVEQLPGYAQGDWWVQDFAASLPIRLLGDVRGRTVIDLCAAPGGKCAQLAANGARTIAVERDRARMKRLQENLARLNLTAETVESDARDFVPDDPAPFVLLDAPCSGTGTIRRHPELPWIKTAADVNACAAAASELLDAAAVMVTDGGALVFAVCSIEPEEGTEQIASFLERHPEFRREPVAAAEIFGIQEVVSDGALCTLPCHFAEHGGMDGFYAARLRRSGR